MQKAGEDNFETQFYIGKCGAEGPWNASMSSFNPDSSLFDWQLQGEYVAEAQQAAASFGPVVVWWAEFCRYVDSILDMAEVHR